MVLITVDLSITDWRLSMTAQVQATMNLVYKANVTDGLFHEHWLVKDGSPTGSTFSSFPDWNWYLDRLDLLSDHFTIGANADSGYEYLLKQWLLSGDIQARDQCMC